MRESKCRCGDCEERTCRFHGQKLEIESDK